MTFEVLQGMLVWLWNLGRCDGGDYDAIAARVLGAGARGVIVKSADGGRWFPQQQAGSTRIVPVTEIVTELRSRGLVVGTWDYCYGGDGNKVYFKDYVPLSYTEERNRAVETITEAKPDFHVFDIEAEWEAQPNAAGRASAFLTSVRYDIPADFPLAYAPLPAIRYHLALPYRQFTDAGCAMLPQTYFTGLEWPVAQTVEWFYADAAQYGLLPQPVFPAYEDAAGVRPTSLQDDEFGKRLITHGATGTSVWSYEHLDAGGWQRVADLAAMFPASKPQPDPCADLKQQLADLTGQRDALAGKLQRIREDAA